MDHLLRRVCRLLGPFGLRATDRRLGASGHRGDTRVLVAPRLIFFLVRRRTAFFKDIAHQRLLDAPGGAISHFRAFLAEEEATMTEMAYAIGYLLRSIFYPTAAFLAALGTLLGTLWGIGRF